MLKKIMSLLLALCLLLGAAAAESALPEFVVPLDEKAVLEKEDHIEGYGWVQEYSRETSAVFLMLMRAEVTADDVMSGMATSNQTSETLIANEGSVKERKVYLSETDNMAVDVTVMRAGEYSAALMLMTEVATYTAGGLQVVVDGWLQGTTIDGAPVVEDVAAAIAATEVKLAEQADEIARQLESGELIAIPKVGISFGGEGEMIDQGGAENAFVQTYQVGDHTVYVAAYLGEYLCDGVWQSFTFELPENQLLAEDERGIRQRKCYDYGAHTGDVTVVWNNGCTIAVVTAVTDEEYQSGMQETIGGWIESLTINGVNVVTPAE